MGEALTVIGVSAAAFIATNLDNLILLVALYARYNTRTVMVTLAYITGMTVIGSLCLVIGLGGGVIPIAYVGFLGIMPVLMGIFALAQLVRGNQEQNDPPVQSHTSANTVFAGVFLTQLSNSTDSIITFSVFLADSTPATDYLIAMTFLAMSAFFVGLALYALRQQKLSAVLDKYGRYLTPVILILVGVYILSNTASDLMPG